MEGAIVSLVYLAVAMICLGAALVLLVFAKISTSQGGAVGIFVLAIILLCTLSAVLLVVWLSLFPVTS